MRRKRMGARVLGLLIVLASLGTALAGDSLYGKVTEVRSGELVVLDYGTGTYTVRLIGIDAPKEGAPATEATSFVSKMVLGKNARIRFDHKAANGEMVSRLLADDPKSGVKDVGIELIRAGLARRQQNYDYKYGELAAAEEEAKKARRGIWAQPSQPK